MHPFPRVPVTAALAAVALAAGATTATAEPPARGYELTTPEWLRYDQPLSLELAHKLSTERHYDGLPTELGVEAYASDDGLAFYVYWVRATEPARDVALAVRRTFDRVRQDATASDPNATLVSWREDVSDTLAVGELEWRHETNETVARVVTMMYASADRRPRQVRGECVMRAAELERLRPRCDAALAALTLTDDDRAALGAIPSAGTLRVSDEHDGGPMLVVVEPGLDAGASTGPSLRPPTKGAVLYQPPARSRSNGEQSSTVFYLGGAVLLIIAIYMLTRRPGDEDETSE